MPDAQARMLTPVTNIIAVKPGRQSEAIALVSHYDSPPESRGAADDGLGVAVCVEAGRVLALRESPRYTLVVALTDGEELGLMGARALRQAPEFAAVRAYINIEAVGTSGPARLFQAGPGNSWLAAAWARSAPHPAGSSLFTGDLPPAAERHRLLGAQGVGRARAELRAHREHVRVSHPSRHAGAAGTPHARHARREHHPPGRGARTDRHPPAHDRRRHLLRRGRAVRRLLLGPHDARPGRGRVRAGPARRRYKAFRAARQEVGLRPRVHDHRVDARRHRGGVRRAGPRVLAPAAGHRPAAAVVRPGERVPGVPGHRRAERDLAGAHGRPRAPGDRPALGAPGVRLDAHAADLGGTPRLPAAHGAGRRATCSPGRCWPPRCWRW